MLNDDLIAVIGQHIDDNESNISPGEIESGKKM